MKQFLLFLMIFVGLIGCTATDCDEKLDTCDGRGGFDGIWSEDDQMLGVVVKHYGDTLGESDNQSFLYTLNADGSNLNQHLELAQTQELLHVNRSHQYAILRRITETQFIDWPAQYSLVDLASNQETLLKDLGQEDCRSYRIIPSLDGDFLAVVEAFSQYSAQSSVSGNMETRTVQSLESKDGGTNVRSATSTPVWGFVHSSQHSAGICNPMALKITMLDATTLQAVSDVQSNVADFSYEYFFGGPIEDRVELFWSDAGLVVKGFVPSISEYALIDIAGNLYTGDVQSSSCEIPVTSSTRVSGGGMVAEVFAFVGLESAEIELNDYVNSNGETLCE